MVAIPSYANPNLLIVGDSLSAGYGIRIREAWPSLLQRRLDQQQIEWHIVNASISGDTTVQGLKRLPKLLAQYQPKIVILALGANDGLRGLPILTIRDNLSTLIHSCRKSGAQAILAGMRLPPNYGPDYTREFAAVYPQLAQQENVTFIPLLLEKVDEDFDLMQADGLHPTAFAQKIILENVWRVLKNQL